ncbi:MAG: VWA domain-containing protein [Nitrososphaerota archaeon]|nr:VWA domain-containing protein [Nitrososphaerota archaeon]MDG7026168.1 VWA domain-containing protein [Nitrososphaerota archaeon]
MWDILYAVDASSSMADTHRSPHGTSFVKMSLVASTIVGLLDGGQLPFGSRLGVMTFQAPTRAGGMFLKGGEEMMKVAVPISPIGSMAKAQMQAALAGVKVGGATPTGMAIEEGLRLLYAADNGPLRRIKKLVMVTDEKSNVGPKPEKVVSDEVALKAIIDVIAIGGKINRGTLEKVAAKTGGKFMIVESAEELLQAMKPRIDVRGLGVDAGLLADVARSELELENAKRLGATSMEYRQALERARGVRARANKRLMEVMMLRSQADSDVKVLVSELQRGMPMADYARRVWPRASELDQAEKVEKELKAAMERLAA